MKKSLTLAAVAILFAVSSFASPNSEPTNKKVVETFSKVFSKAQSVQWQEKSNFYSATFKLNGSYLTAHFSPAAEFLGVSRNLTPSQLPLHLFSELKKKYSNYWITDLFEYATKDQDSYYITLENSNHILILEGDGSGFNTYRKIVK